VLTARLWRQRFFADIAQTGTSCGNPERLRIPPQSNLRLYALGGSLLLIFLLNQCFEEQV
jgi:hypothetical protein